jgi:hypothetical protein
VWHGTIYKISVHNSQETHYVSATETNRLMLFGEIIAGYCDNHTERINTLCGQNAWPSDVKQTVQIVTSVLEKPGRGWECCIVPSLCSAGDVEDCLVQPLPQGQFTPLPEALCWVILDLTSSGQAAVLERIRSALQVAFPDIQRPSQEIVYDALAKLTTERKVSKVSCLIQVFCSPPTSLTSLPTALLPGVRSRVC